MVSYLLLGSIIRQFNSNAFGFLFLNNKHVHVISEKLARVSNINGGFDFVARKDPDLNARRLNVRNGATYLVLQLVFNSS